MDLKSETVLLDSGRSIPTVQTPRRRHDAGACRKVWMNRAAAKLC